MEQPNSESNQTEANQLGVLLPQVGKTTRSSQWLQGPWLGQALCLLHLMQRREKVGDRPPPPPPAVSESFVVGVLFCFAERDISFRWLVMLDFQVALCLLGGERGFKGVRIAGTTEQSLFNLPTTTEMPKPSVGNSPEGPRHRHLQLTAGGLRAWDCLAARRPPGDAAVLPSPKQTMGARSNGAHIFFGTRRGSKRKLTILGSRRPILHTHI